MTPEAPESKGTGAVNTKGAWLELARVRWRAAMMAAGRIDQLRSIAKGGKFQEKLTYNPEIEP